MLLEVKNLKVYFYGGEEPVKAVDGAGLRIEEGQMLALVGESGSGKSVTALSITRLLPRRNCRIEGGQVIFTGRDLLNLDDESLRGIRGREISYIFQEPASSLNPLFTIGFQIAEAIMTHKDVGRRDALKMAMESLEIVGMPSVEEAANFYPHQLSGGMRQRAMIAMAISMRPKLLVADEPTTALDVTIEAQILELLSSLKERLGMSILLITHDLRIVQDIADRVTVMRNGKIIENGAVKEIFEYPRSDYTKMLLRCLP